MAQPTAYNRLYDFVAYALAHTSQPYNSSYLDAELDAVETTLDGICTNLALIQRDDGALKNASVHVDSFTTASLALIASDWTPRGLWVTATAYVVGDVVQNSTSSYVCATAHTSGTFNTDYTAGKWIILGQTVGTVASGISCSAYGHIASTNVQAFLEELVDEKARLAGSTSQTFDVADASDDTHAVAAGQVQKDNLRTAAGGGTSDAITATISSGLTTLTDRMAVRVRAAAANGTTTPTFNLTLGSTATGAKTIKKGAGSALVEGDIAGAGHNLELVYDATLDCWLLQNPAYAVALTTAGIEPDTVENFGIAFSVGSNALTASVKTAAGGVPTTANPVKAALRSSSASTGTYNTRQITSALTMTVSSGSTLGHSSGIESSLHWYLIDNSGTLELAVSSHFYGYGGIVSTTAEGGAGAADSATVMYSTSARSSVPFTWVATTKDTQVTAGTWASNPTTVDLTRDVRLETAVAVGNTIAARTNSGTPNSQVDITATELVLKDSAGRPFVAKSVSVTVDITASGANGLDTGAEAGDTWYYGWVIAKPDGAVAGLLSTSSTAPTMPSGYTFKALVTSVRNNGSSNLVPFRQRGNEVFYETAQSAFSSSSGHTSEQTVSLAALIPSIAHSCQAALNGAITAGGGDVSSALYFRIVSGSTLKTVQIQTPSSSTGQVNADWNMPNVSQQIFWLFGNATNISSLGIAVNVLSFTLPGGGA